MHKKIWFFLLVGYVCVTCPGCSPRGWYEGVKEMQRQDCYKIESSAERKKCLDKLDNMSYDQYEKERADSMKQSENK